eukprot:CAMPEP_0179297138 /NCGR_PEP_ID=MMETSP0797-20121207/45304_1 /TAXON_ID=47934 /ORGANISM="Dinophysis acuminata, Strain DAEP01" /LENGTH=34 /DNA_ID= /DNA_START= /DNA_END= /DNA_ORIENTATION=
MPLHVRQGGVNRCASDERDATVALRQHVMPLQLA